MTAVCMQGYPRWMRTASMLAVLAVSIQVQYISGSAQQPSADYTSLGPCSVANPQIPSLLLPKASGCGFKCTLDVHVTAPAAQSSLNNWPCPAAPYPVVVLYNGFQLPSSYYASYARHLASWGFAVVQYDLPLFTLTPDDVEVGFFPYLLHHVQSQSAVSQLLDLSHLATAGHSRGGKLAALQLAANPQVLSSFLIDPVDSTGPGYPSAAKALAGRNKQLGMAAAGVSGPCNPVKTNYRSFWDVAGGGSWLEEVPGAGHLQFANITSIFTRALDFLCKVGSDSRQEVIQLTMPTLIAWMEATLRSNMSAVAAAAPAQTAASFLKIPKPQRGRQLLQHQSTNSKVQHDYKSKVPDPADTVQQQTQDAGLLTRRPQLGSLQAFFQWVQRQEEDGAIEFQIK